MSRRDVVGAAPLTPVAAGQGTSRRLWRLRKRHQSVDAELWSGDGAGVELRYLLGGGLTYRRIWESRDAAIREAMAKRAELEREGWTFHW